jgi:flagellar assembly protein FliH
MLSKVLTGRAKDRAQPLHPAAVIASRHPDDAEPVADAAESAALRRENLALHDRIHQLEAEHAVARRESFEAGRLDGDRQARAETAPVLDRLAISLAQLAELRQEIRLKAEQDMVQLALLIAKRILHRELSTDTSALIALARVVFDRMARGESLRVTVHPHFAPSLAAALSRGQTARIHIEPDPSQPLGTFIVRSEEGVLDASVEAQLEEISRGLTDRLTGGMNVQMKA